MPYVTMASHQNKVDGSIKNQVLDFLHKLQKDDTTPGLHIEPMIDARDRRARTGRVSKQYRAVLFRLDSGGQAHYIYHGTYNHDDAIRIARNTILDFNLALGMPEFRYEEPVETPEPVFTPRVTYEQTAPTEPIAPEWVNHLPENWNTESLIEAGISEAFAAPALAASTPAELTAVIDRAPEAQGLMLLGLATGDSLEAVRTDLGLPATPATDDSDDSIVEALKSSSVGFVYVGESPDELREALESMDIDRWRVFLHPEQKRYAEGSWKGAYRLSGGAGTGKTVVLLHRARYLYRGEPDSRIVLTTFTRTLADSLAENFSRLAPKIPQVGLGEPGVAITGIDQIASHVLATATDDEKQLAAERVLGVAATIGNQRVTNAKKAWDDAVVMADPDVTEELANPAFLEQEYVYIVLANRILDERSYVRVARTGRGTPLNRRQRQELWKVFAQFRATTQIDGQLSFPEVAALAAEILEAREAPIADHVLVDEAQDLNPLHWQLLRALVAEGRNDLFIAEDSHQRIYGHKITLSQYGINIRGRARRLRLNYRTTAENLAYAISILDGNAITDLEGEGERSDDYRSVRSGPAPRILDVSNADDEMAAVASEITRWIDDGVKPEAIGVLARAESRARDAASALVDRNIPASQRRRDAELTPGQVPVMTMHSAKGIEFQHVIVLGAGSGEIPAPWAIDRLTEADREDAILRERSLLYVAATRARDELVVTRRAKETTDRSRSE